MHIHMRVYVKVAIRVHLPTGKAPAFSSKLFVCQAAQKQLVDKAQLGSEGEDWKWMYLRVSS